LWEPSQNGLFLERPQAHIHKTSPEFVLTWYGKFLSCLTNLGILFPKADLEDKLYKTELTFKELNGV
jgi:hypothetical protein